MLVTRIRSDNASPSKDPYSLPVAKPSLYSAKSFVLAATISLAYLLLSYILIGYKPDQLFLVALFNSLFFLSRTTRHFITGFSVFMVYWIIFDYMKAFPNYRYNTVHIESLYQIEKQLFGFMSGGVRVTPNEFFAQHHSTFVDVLSGFFYLCWVPVPLLFAGFLFFRNRRYFYQFAFTFFLVNLIGFVGYYVYPAAPPWYISLHGFDFIAHTPGNTAGLSRFDAYFGTHIFEGLYSKSSNVFAAMPSLHAAYMLIVLYFGIITRMGKWNVLFAIILLGIWFTAVYSSHHYVLDVLAGITCGLLGIFLFQKFTKTRIGTRFLDGCVRVSS